MIYDIGDTVIDLSKLEYVSKVFVYAPENQNGFDFNYQINGCVYSSHSYGNEGSAKYIRDNLIKAWKEYKDQK